MTSGESRVLTRLAARSARVFISYHSTERDFARAVFERLAGRFGRERVFLDVESIPYGRSFLEVIEERLRTVDVVVAVIGHDWIQRVQDDDDYVRLELSLAETMGVPVLPVRKQTIPQPLPHLLPDELRFVAAQQTASIADDRMYDAYMARLADGAVVLALRHRLGVLRRLALRTTRIGAVAAAAAFLVGILVATHESGSKPTRTLDTVAFAPRTAAPSSATKPTARPPSAAPARSSTSPKVTVARRPTLGGMRGTTDLSPPNKPFEDELREFQRASGLAEIEEMAYAAQTYDAVVVVALAAVEARDDGVALARHVVDVTTIGQRCLSFAACAALIANGADIDYDGASGRVELGPDGDPLVGSYALKTFGADDRIDETKTSYVMATRPPPAMTATSGAPRRTGDGVLRIGALLPAEGALSHLDAAQRAGFELAIADVNASGGVLGRAVEMVEADGSDANVVQATEDLLANGVDAIVGAPSSSATLLVLDRVTGAGVVMISPSNTSEDLSLGSDRGLYFRTAPSDAMQSALIGRVVVEDGSRRVVLLVQDADYYRRMANEITAAARAAATDVTVRIVEYHPGGSGASGVATQVAQAGTDAVIVVGADDAHLLLHALAAAGMGTDHLRTYGIDNVIGNTLGERFDGLG